MGASRVGEEDDPRGASLTKSAWKGRTRARTSQWTARIRGHRALALTGRFFDKFFSRIKI
jgi:hypothetical protein